MQNTEVPFIVLGDGGLTASADLAAILDNRSSSAGSRPMIAIQIGNGGQMRKAASAGAEYDTVSGSYTQFVEREVLPLVEQKTGAKLTKNPDGRATMGLSSSGAAAFTMAWFHPELYRRVLVIRRPMVNQQWPTRPVSGGAPGNNTAHGPDPLALISTSSRRDLALRAALARRWIPSALDQAHPLLVRDSDQDLFYPNPVMADGMHDWVLSAERMAKVLADKGYHYQFLFARNSKHRPADRRPNLTVGARMAGGRAIRSPSDTPLGGEKSGHRQGHRPQDC